MSGDFLEAPADGAFDVGPVKILLDEGTLPDLAELVLKIRTARRWGRRIAVHCVTPAELAFALAAFDEVGAGPGDRVEHGSVIPAAAVPILARMRITVVTQPSFIFERGDAYRENVEAEDQSSLYRCASLLEAHIKVAGSSDAPYTRGNPWDAVATAISRYTRAGYLLGGAERVAPTVALNLFLGPVSDPGGLARRVDVGANADFCVLGDSLRQTLADPRRAHVAATVVAGNVVYRRS
jgi:predicted amidohydrolase YtcJ